MQTPRIAHCFSVFLAVSPFLAHDFGALRNTSTCLRGPEIPVPLWLIGDVAQLTGPLISRHESGAAGSGFFWRRSGGKKIALRGGGGDTEAHFPNPPPSLLGRRDGRGGFRAGGGPTCRAGGGGGVSPTSMAQNDTHVALIILTTQMWGGNYWWKKLFRAKFCVPVRLAPTSVLTQNEGPDTEPHFSNPPPPSFGGRPCHPPPPPPQSNFQVASGQHSHILQSGFRAAMTRTAPKHRPHCRCCSQILMGRSPF